MGKLFCCSVGSLLISLTLLTACGKKAKLEVCTFVTVEKPEAEVQVGDVDVEGGEVEMVCGDKIFDVPWSEFKKQLKLDPKAYIGKVEELRKEATCLWDENSNTKQVSCNTTANSGQYVSLKFNPDD
jgi:hypothetical protein